MSKLFEPLRIRDLTFPNRVWVSPMCQYSATEGVPGDWHLVHLGQFATGGAGLVMTEAAAVSDIGRISAQDAGIWNDAQIPAWRRITDFLHAHGAVTGIQLAHAGRKASARRPWEGTGTISIADGGWEPVAPSAAAFDGYATPRELTATEIADLPRQFAEAARRSVDAGFDVIELHFAHGYLLHEFYSPLSNTRTDEYGGDFEGRTRILLEVADAVRAEIGAAVPLFARISATDWVDGGWTAEDSVRLAKLLGEHGIDLVDASTGGNDPRQSIPVGPGYQVPFADRVRSEAGLPTAAVGMITEPRQAEEILASGAADAVFIGRAMLRDPHWALRAAHELGDEVRWPEQYARAKSWH